MRTDQSRLLKAVSESAIIDAGSASDPELALTSEELVLSEPRTAMITGAGGLLGRSMSARLGHSGWRVVASHSQLTSPMKQVSDAVTSIHPDVLINCVATADVDRCEIDPEWAYAVNAITKIFGSRVPAGWGDMVHVSTDYAFDGSSKASTRRKTSPTRPVYGKSACRRAYGV
jgi:dTDP-4-dehydrorhamnose reductase